MKRIDWMDSFRMLEPSRARWQLSPDRLMP